MISHSFPPFRFYHHHPQSVLLGNLSAAVVLTAVDQGGSQAETERKRQKPWEVAPSEVDYIMLYPISWWDMTIVGYKSGG